MTIPPVPVSTITFFLFITPWFLTISCYHFFLLAKITAFLQTMVKQITDLNTNITEIINQCISPEKIILNTLKCMKYQALIFCTFYLFIRKSQYS